eukprot:2192360-Pyramimonas_sp.AAC.1
MLPLLFFTSSYVRTTGWAANSGRKCEGTLAGRPATRATSASGRRSLSSPMSTASSAHLALGEGSSTLKKNSVPSFALSQGRVIARLYCSGTVAAQ